MDKLFKDFDIVFICGTSWLSKAIRWFTKSPYTHVGIYYKGVMWEALSRGVVPCDINNYANSKIEVLSMSNLTYNEKHELEKALFKTMRNIKYDFVNLLVYQPIYQVTGRWVGDRSYRRMLCSEFVIRSVSEAGLESMAGLTLDMDTITPQTLYDILLSTGTATKAFKKDKNLIIYSFK